MSEEVVVVAFKLSREHLKALYSVLEDAAIHSAAYLEDDLGVEDPYDPDFSELSAEETGAAKGESLNLKALDIALGALEDPFIGDTVSVYAFKGPKAGEVSDGVWAIADDPDNDEAMISWEHWPDPSIRPKP